MNLISGVEPKSISNRSLKLLRKLHRKKYRWKEQLFFVEGERAVMQIKQHGQLEIKELFFDASRQCWQQQPWKAMASGLECSVVSKDDYAEVTDTDTPQGVMALCRMPEEPDPAVMARGAGLIVATDAIQDPGNMGTIIRTASWFGAGGLLSGKGTVDLYHPKVVRSTAGAVGVVPHANVDLEDALPVFEQQGWETILLDAGPDATPLQQIQKREKIVLVIGNEANGINSKLFKESNRQKARIASPRNAENVESLNAAIATSIAMYALV